MQASSKMSKFWVSFKDCARPKIGPIAHISGLNFAQPHLYLLIHNFLQTRHFQCHFTLYWLWKFLTWCSYSFSCVESKPPSDNVRGKSFFKAASAFKYSNPPASCNLGYVWRIIVLASSAVAIAGKWTSLYPNPGEFDTTLYGVGGTLSCNFNFENRNVQVALVKNVIHLLKGRDKCLKQAKFF